MWNKKLTLVSLGLAATVLIGAISAPAKLLRAEATADYEPVEISYSITGDDEEERWELVTDFASLRNEEIVTLVSYLPLNPADVFPEEKIYVMSGWNKDEEAFTSLSSNYLLFMDEGILYAPYACQLYLEKVSDSSGYLSTFSGGVNKFIGAFNLGGWDLSPTYDNPIWNFEIDPDEHNVVISQYNSLWDDTVYINNQYGTFYGRTYEFHKIYLFRSNISYSGTRAISDIKHDGSSDIDDFATFFLDKVGNACNYNGNTDFYYIYSAFAQVKKSTKFTSLSDVSKKIFKYATADEDGDNVQQAAALYDYVMNKYGYMLEWYDMYENEFFGRSEFYSNEANNIVTNDSRTTAIVTVVLLSTVTGLTALGLILKKKKETN